MAYNPKLELLDTLHACATVCSVCAGTCLSEKSIEALAGCIKINIECADVCRLAASSMSRRSFFLKDLLMICATVCEACAKECDKHAYMEHCQRCADACRVCAEICLQEANL